MKSFNFVKYFLILFSIAALFLLLSFFGLLAPVEGFLGRIISPVVSFFNNASIKIKEVGKSVKELGNLQKENKDLLNKVKELTLEVNELKELKTENESLKKQLGFIESTNHKTLAAAVLAKDPSSFLKAIIINRGSKDGVKKNMAVVSDGFLVGRVQEVNTDNSKVILLTDSNFQVNGMIQESRALGIVKGQIGSGLAMETIPKDQDVKVNDTVITSNLEADIPEGLLIGKVIGVDTESGGLFQKASIVSFSNLDDIRNVVLISPR